MRTRGNEAAPPVSGLGANRRLAYGWGMRRIAKTLGVCALLVGLLGAPALAEDAPAEETPGEDPLGESLDLFGRGAELFFRGLIDEIGPELEQLQPRMRDFADGLGPMIAGLAELIDEIDAYHPPEILPNGDIILRRKDPMEREDVLPDGGESNEIEI